MRHVCPVCAATCDADSSPSQISALPSVCLTTGPSSAGNFTKSAARPKHPVTANARAGRSRTSRCLSVSSGKKVARPCAFSLSTAMARLAVDSVSVTMSPTCAPKATSMATSYRSSVAIRLPTAPSTPCMFIPNTYRAPRLSPSICRSLASSARRRVRAPCASASAR